MVAVHLVQLGVADVALAAGDVHAGALVLDGAVGQDVPAERQVSLTIGCFYDSFTSATDPCFPEFLASGAAQLFR